MRGAIGIVAVCLSMLASVSVGQRMSAATQPAASGSHVTWLMHCDGTLNVDGGAASVKDAVVGEAKFVAGRFGQAVHVGEKGLVLTTGRAISPMRGTIEIDVRAKDDAWFASDHVLMANDVEWGKPGKLQIWYRAETGRIRFDFHNFGQGYDAWVDGEMLRDTAWHRIAATWDAARGLKIYVDGKRVGQIAGQWSPTIAMPARVRVCPQGGAMEIDELRIGDAAWLGVDENAIEMKMIRGEARVEKGRTIQPVRLEWVNNSSGSVSLSGDVRVIDSYQNTRADRPIRIDFGAGQKHVRVIDVPVDGAGAYVKVATTLAEGDRFAVVDEQLMFVDMLVGPRVNVSLVGAWEWCVGESNVTTAVPGNAAWSPCELPYKWFTWGDRHTRWFRKSVMLPRTMAGKTIELNLSGVRYSVAVFCNGVALGRFDTDQMATSVDITSAAKVGEKNEILLAVTDWISCVAPETLAKNVALSITAPGFEMEGRPIIRACGGLTSPGGIVDPISIIARPAVTIDEVRVTPSVRKKTLAVVVPIRSNVATTKAMTLRVSVMDGDAVVTSVDVPVEAKSGLKAVETVVPIELGKITLWWPGKPKLYRCRAMLMDGETMIDVCDVRFGIREVWVEGDRLMLNGVAIRPKSAAGWPNDFAGVCGLEGRSTIGSWMAQKRHLQSLMDIGVTIVRYHTEPYPTLMLDLADELGMMVVTEGVISSIPNKLKIDDPRLWENLREFYAKWVRREFNHPSLVIRSIENEIGYFLPGPSQIGNADACALTLREYSAIGRQVKKLDPSRPIMYDGSGPIFNGVADILNTHYPEADGLYNLWPTNGRWLEKPSACYHIKAWTWDRKKPLYVGEFGWYASVGPEEFSAVFGDETYCKNWYDRYKGLLWKMMVEGSRCDGITTISPWTIINAPATVMSDEVGGVREYRQAIAPIATFVREYREVYFGGRNVDRTLTTINDSLETREVTVRWRLSEEKDSAVVAKGEFVATLAPTEIKATPVRLALPTVTKRTNYAWTIETCVGDRVVHRDQRKFIVCADERSAIVVTSRIGVIGVDEKAFAKVGVSVKSIDASAKASDDIDVLFVASNARNVSAAAIARFVRRGGRCIVLGDRTSPTFLPMTLKLVDGASSPMTIVHPRLAESPLLRGLDASMLRWWREGEMTVARSYMAVEGGFGRSVIDCGKGLRQSAMVEMPIGRGVIVASTLPMIELLDDQPAARAMFENVIRYADAYRSDGAKLLGVVAESNGAVESFLSAMGAECVNLSGKLDRVTSLSEYGVIVVECSEAALAEVAAHRGLIDAYVSAGGVVWAHGASAERVSTLNAMLPAPISLNALTVRSAIRLSGEGLVAGASSDSVYWPENANFFAPLSSRVARASISSSAKNAKALAEPAVAMSMSAGRGQWLIDTIAWESEFSEIVRARNFVRAILMNCGVQASTRQNSASVAELGCRPIALEKFCNSALSGAMWGGETMGLHKFPVGEQTLKGVRYRLVDPSVNAGRACVAFRSSHNTSGCESLTVPVGRSAAAIDLLLTSLWSGTLAPMTPVLSMDVAYADGTTATTQIVTGRDVLDWCRPMASQADTQGHGRVAWVGPEFPNPGVYAFAWDNPHRDKTIREIRLTAAHKEAFAVVLAITTQDRAATKASTKDWVPGMPKP